MSQILSFDAALQRKWSVSLLNKQSTTPVQTIQWYTTRKPTIWRRVPDLAKAAKSAAWMSESGFADAAASSESGYPKIKYPEGIQVHTGPDSSSAGEAHIEMLRTLQF